MEDTSFDLLCKGLSVEEAKVFRKIIKEWCDGDENSFPVQLALLTRAQWQAAARIPQTIEDSGKLMEAHLDECRRHVAAIVKELSIVSKEHTVDLRDIVKIHTEKVNQASVSIRDKLWEVAEAARQIRNKLDEGTAAWNRARTDLEAGSGRFQRACKELDDRITLRELRRDWLILLGLISLGIAIGVLACFITALKHQ